MIDKSFVMIRLIRLMIKNLRKVQDEIYNFQPIQDKCTIQDNCIRFSYRLACMEFGIRTFTFYCTDRTIAKFYELFRMTIRTLHTLFETIRESAF